MALYRLQKGEINYMAKDLNQCNFIGRLGRDVESKTTADGKTIARFSIAVNGYRKDDPATWVTVVAFDKLAQICNQYLNKGKQVFVSGRMQTRSWEKDGITRYATEIVADQMQMLGDSGGSQGGGSGYQSQKPQAQQEQGPVDESDIPF